MADLQMKLLRKKIQKRNEKNKKRQQIKKETEDEDTGTCCKDGVLRLTSIVFSYFLGWWQTLHARLTASLARYGEGF